VFNVLLQQVFDNVPILYAYNPHANENRTFKTFGNAIYANVDEGQKPKILKLLSDWTPQLSGSGAAGSPKRPQF
jgi:hypothetical protein